MSKLKWAWHIHHQILIETLIEPIENRIKFIKENKPEEEHKLRLKLLKEVKGEIPKPIIKAYVKAREAYDKAWEAYDKALEAHAEAWEAHAEAWEAYIKARKAYIKKINTNKTLLALHKKECGCNWNGKNIFN